MKKLLFVMFVFVGTLVFAQVSDADNLQINAAVNPRATLVISHAAINFADADPDTVPSIAATENGAVQFTVRRRGAGTTNFTLTMTAAPDLSKGSGTDIGIGNVTWTTPGAGGFNANGTMGVGAAVGSWTGSGNVTSSMSFFLANSWSYEAGSYSSTVTYTLASV